MSDFPTSPEIVDNALLLATLPDLEVPNFLSQVIAHATTHTRSRLLVVFFCRQFNTRPHRSSTDFPSKQAVPHTQQWSAVQRLLTFTYVQATKVAQSTNKVLMNIDVLLKGLNEDLDPAIGNGMQIVFRVSGDSIAVPLPESISFLRVNYLEGGDRDHYTKIPDSPTHESLPPSFPVTALGGTFDHLHAGHKILLSMAAWITSQKLIVGITEDDLLRNKANKHVIDPLETRSAHVRQFLTLFKPEIEVDVVPIRDVYGPTGWDPNIQALVVSKETMSGAAAIAQIRKEKELPSLHTFMIDVISATNASLDDSDADWLRQHKLSSTFIRQWIVDNL